MRSFIAAVLLGAASHVHANSFGAPVCEVNFLPLIPMASSVSNPAPTGWQLALQPTYLPGETVTVRIFNNNPAKRVRGILLWAKESEFSGAGQFVPGPSSVFQFVQPQMGMDNCQQWAVTHTDSVPKDQALLSFNWVPPTGGFAFMRAFVIEDCGQSNCRSAQALTGVSVISQGFINGFEN
jgi:hypothetical protein